MAMLEPEFYKEAPKKVYKTKLNPNDTIQKHKQLGIDNNEMFTLVAHFDTIKALIALITQKGWSIYQLDVKLAFLNGVMEE
ncbi:hypothetical protein CR513_50331, partial [Mucuna pruriens]